MSFPSFVLSNSMDALAPMGEVLCAGTSKVVLSIETEDCRAVCAEQRRMVRHVRVAHETGGSAMADLTVDDVMRRWPATIRVFLDFRMGCVGCPIAAFPFDRRRLPRTRHGSPASWRSSGSATRSVLERGLACLSRRWRLRRVGTACADRAARCAGGRPRPGPAAPTR